MTITLIGMPGVGKSSMGKFLAKKLNLKFIDGDKYITKITGKSIQEIIDQNGIAEFQKIEREILQTIEQDNAVIAPGGSAIYYDEVMEHFKGLGKVIYLYAGIPVITERLGDFSKRGVVLKNGYTLKDMFNERIPLLEKHADIKINCNGNNFLKYQDELLSTAQALLSEKK
jgi:shikimate kinase